MKTANIKDYNQYYRGYILIENMTDLIDFRNEVTNGLIKESAKDLVRRSQDADSGKHVPHATDAITIGTEMLTNISGQGVLYSQAKMMGSYLNEQDRLALSGKRIAINPINKVSYFNLSDSAEIEIISQSVEYTKDDIKVYKWETGSHYYAKIGLMDVVVDGEQKWNARWVAQKKAEEFLEILNKK